MNIENRLKKMENQTAAYSKFCGCGTPFFRANATFDEPITNEFCPDCAKPVKPMTFMELALLAEREEKEMKEK